jgi:S-formylglutathione hydrolase FrmB
MRNWLSVFLLFIAFLFIAAGCSGHRSQDAEQRQFAQGNPTVTEVRFASASLGQLLCYRAIVPSTQPGERLPVLYFLHGANSGPDEVLQSSQIVQLAATERLIVILPDAGFSYYTNAQYGFHSRWEDAITTDLRADAEARFPILGGREHRGIAGISMGGYGAAKLALKHPELYAWVGVLSGALDITVRPMRLRRLDQCWRICKIFGLRRSTRMPEDVFVLLAHQGNPSGQRWMIACGRKDPLFGVNRRFAGELKKRGTSVSWSSAEGGHDWGSWNSLLQSYLQDAAGHLH